jgi:hypothetical protein
MIRERAQIDYEETRKHMTRQATKTTVTQHAFGELLADGFAFWR